MSTKTKVYSIYDKQNGKILSANVSRQDVSLVEDALTHIGYDVIIKEDACAGSTSTGSIAVNMDGGKEHRKSFLKFLGDWQNRIVNKFSPKQFKISITEDFDIESVFSRLSSMEKIGSTKKTEGTTFGVEDDEGNIMKVTVRSDQAKDFEMEVARYLADIKANVVGRPSPRGASDISMAELLFKLKDRFDIIDVNFPKIPDDVVYNADKASTSPATSTGSDDLGMGDGMDAGLDGDDAGGMDDINNPLDMTDYKQAPGEEGTAPGEPLMRPEDENEGESVDDFEEPPVGGTDEESILGQVISMLKAQAEAATEQAKAEAEKARADQARYTAQATAATINNQEEGMRYDLEMEANKKREKEASRLADIAKFKVGKAMGLNSVREGEEVNSNISLQDQRQQVLQSRADVIKKYTVLPADDQATRTYKTQQRSEALRELNSKLVQIQNAERYVAQQKAKQTTPTQRPTQQSPQQQPQQNGQQPPQQQNGQAAPGNNLP